MKEYLTEIIAFVTGGGILTFFNYFREKRQDNMSEFITIIERYKSIIEDQDKKIQNLEQLRTAFENLKDEISRLKSKILILETHYVDYPFPAWLKDTNGVMLALNEQYEECFLIPMGKTMMQYIGKTDFEIWDETMATQFIEHDKLILKSKKNVWMGDEVIKIDGVDVSKEYRIIKFKRYAGNTVIGTGGFAIPIN